MSRLWDTEVPWPEPMNETEAAKALTAWEKTRRLLRFANLPQGAHFRLVDVLGNPASTVWVKYGSGAVARDFDRTQAIHRNAEVIPEPREDACPYCDSTGGYESVGFGPDAPFVRCRECGHMVTRG